MSDSFELEAPETFTVGAVGRPGERVFYLQARQGRTLVTLKVEKGQVSALAEYLAGLLDKLPAPGGAPPGDPDLHEPLEPTWVVGSLGVGYDEGDQRILVVAEEQTEDEAGPEHATARFRITPAQATAFVERTRELVRAGRPLCPVCGRPRDPDGHVCPRTNGAHG